MNSIETQLVKALLDGSGWTKASALAQTLNVSSRSIKNYVAQFNATHNNVIESSRNGYCISPEIATELLANASSEKEVELDRVAYIINELVKEASVDAFSLCEDLFISMSTLKNELKKVKRKVQKFDLTLENKNDYLSLQGIEKNKRKLVSSILYEESSVNFVNLKSLQDGFPSIDIDFIKATVVQTFETYKYFINDYSLTNLVLHITIAIDRIQSDYTSTLEDSTNIKHPHEHRLAQIIASRLEEEFHITYNDSEIYELSLLIAAHANAIDLDNINHSNLEDLIEKDTLDLVNNLVDGVNAFYYINLKEPEFLTRFALHIRNLLVRAKFNYSSKNPLAAGIQYTCPLIYDAAIYMASGIEEATNIKINEDEIAYIAFHLGSALETQKAIQNKINALLYCPNYYDMNSKLVDSIHIEFSNYILIKNVVTSEAEIENYDMYDLVISTIPISGIIPIPTLIVSFMFNEKDRYAIRTKVNEILIAKKQSILRTHLKTIILDEMFETNKSLKTSDEVIHYLCDKAYSLDYVDETFEEQIQAREQMSSTAFNSFAIPHAMRMTAKKTGINILISPTGITWGDKVVNLVMMLSFNINERFIFNEIFDTITMILSEPENVKQIIQAKDADQFIELLVSYVNEP
ncbi:MULTISPECIES: PRD domain-containing protein [unclassified Breznakia]|uniref:BglG family transcription antiterminator n=1 Tax=unclassified Breznakia TaxID=2623764 RepID=UPI002472EFE3|nr:MULTISPECIES: PRD domain-containing protein [unclassified Breznakia]MDH6367676.1 lichenan operon transcriptional antiterminator [Breznakia sp. PH1-1]MDH6404731.1 lichenan operon transcriptional antiterminator [Breznakia sp. PF1-11]MDH6412446.1 lichenan operon transcriptional antiterminator [Breznakia sp. PFB1-11]MDH6414806.1 lichenan operon transcriptional antiterminator [Breznakia sp. PFB1-14]MDH6417150.1 lichenan operon transcriptional antiterminator [Breznakia sp. PFB1-4]